MAVGQAYEDAETLRVDLMAEDMSARIGEVRLFKAEGLDGVVMSGTLAGIGGGAWAIACTGP